MSETKEKDTKDANKDEKVGGKKTLSLSSSAKKGGTLTLGAGAPSSASTARTPAGSGVAVEMRRRRSSEAKPTEDSQKSSRTLTESEREARMRALQEAQSNKAEAKPKPKQALPEVKERRPEPSKDDLRQKELEELEKIEQEEQQKSAQQAETRKQFEENLRRQREKEEAEQEKKKAVKAKKAPADRKRNRKFTVTEILNEDYERDRGPSLAAQRRQREKEKMRMSSNEPIETVKQNREVTVPETITVQELSNRMAEKSADVVKALMKMGVMATVTQTIDADTAELIVDEFGHTIKRVTDADIEIGLEGTDDKPENLKPRPPVVTIMGHVDHGKTSLLDALRQANVASGEAGGITQHIGAYQVSVKSGDEDKKVTFIDTPGHAAFSAMRARGANITDIVVLVVAANDSVMPQTIEAISHAKAAQVPIIVAINKIDLPDAEPYKVKQDLLQHEILTEDMGGDVPTVEVSAKTGKGLDDLLEILALQAEILELKANPDREAHGTVVESKMEKGKGSVATVLINNGTLHKGDIFVAGSEWGRVRALLNDRGEQIEKAIPGQPIEVLGLQGSPEAGEELIVVENEDRARRISDYRNRKKRDIQAAALASTSIEQMMANQKDAQTQEHLPVIIKADVHGSVEAIIGLLNKMIEDNDELVVKPIHTGVGGITESDVTLAKASNALIIGFNVRANAQARDLAQKESVDIRYYNIIYDVIDDAKAILSGMLSPELREEIAGYAEIREVFNITKVGKVAGCMVTDGMVKRGSKVRLLRDDVVIHEGTLKTLKRHKDEVKEVREGMECGMAFENYDDIKSGDMIECFDIIETERNIA